MRDAPEIAFVAALGPQAASSARTSPRPPHASPYKAQGYVLAGRAELTIGGETATLAPGDSYLVPAHAVHSYRILETFSAIECTSPPAIAAG